ncbi:hypothetical protein LWI28_024144 [Acer negundo]|uniref:Uncharacterized protein n=1 Tax=Acer negundo TaxID=4023 RepID=A0AAD5NUV2_ACENE|nr:hypothetical protein LWI28_024144 [Acer negundo]
MRSRGSKYGSREGFANRGSTSSPMPTASTKTNTKVSTSKREKCPNRRIVSLVEEKNDREIEEDSKVDEYNDQEEDEEVTYIDHVRILFLKNYNINTNSGGGHHWSFPTVRRFGDVGVTKGGRYFLQQWKRPPQFLSPSPFIATRKRR